MTPVRRAIPAAALLALCASAYAAPPAQPIVVQGLECRGDDGSWTLDASRTTATYAASAPRKREVVFRGSLQSIAGGATVWRGDSTHLPRETLVLAARDETCKAPAVGTLRAILSIRPNEAAAGCCAVRAGYDARTAPVATFTNKPADDWARALPDVIAAVNACVARQKSRAQSVAGAVMEGGTVRVRLIEKGGNAVDCTVPTSGRGAPAIAAVPAAPIAGPLFYPARDTPPIVACGRLERVQLRGGLAGYLHYEPC